MAKQLIKGMAMLVLVASVSFLTATAANAQSRSRLHVNVPFEFTIGDKNLPAGEYNVSSLFNSGDTIVVSNGENAAARLSTNMISPDAQEKSKLVFHRYGERYFLAEVWRAGENSGRRLVSSKGEDAARHELTAVYRSRGIKKDVYERVELVAAVTRD